MTASSTTSIAGVFFASLKAFGSLRNDSSPENFLQTVVVSLRNKLFLLQALVVVLEQATLSPLNCSFSILKPLLIVKKRS